MNRGPRGDRGTGFSRRLASCFMGGMSGHRRQCASRAGATAALAAIVVASLGGCGLGVGGAWSRPPTAPGDGGADPETLAPGFCAGACAARAADGCLAEADCSAHCEKESVGWTTAIGAAFSRCVAANPLCFETVESCLFRELVDPEAPVRVALSGSGFEAYEGKTVHAWHDPARARPFGGTATITGGGFALEWSAAVGPSLSADGPLLLLYVDMDGDGRCSAGADVTHSGYAVWDGNYASPAFHMALAPPLSDADFVCGFPP